MFQWKKVIQKSESVEGRVTIRKKLVFRNRMNVHVMLKPVVSDVLYSIYVLWHRESNDIAPKKIDLDLLIGNIHGNVSVACRKVFTTEPILEIFTPNS